MHAFAIPVFMTIAFISVSYTHLDVYKRQEVDKMVQEFRERRDLIVDLLNDIKGFRCLKPKGAFYAFPNVTQACKNLGFKDAEQLQDYLLYKGDVAVLARTSFGLKNKDEKEEYIRLSYATSKENIIEGLSRIKKAVENNKNI